MKVVVKQQFRDIANYDLVYDVGSTIEVGKERGKHLVSLGLVVKDKTVLDEEKEVETVDNVPVSVDSEGSKRRGRA